MSFVKEWLSPDGRIKKQILSRGSPGLKPSEAHECSVKIEDCSSDYLNLDKYNNEKYVIGNSDCDFERSLDIVLQTMNVEEVSKITLCHEVDIVFNLTLKFFVSKGPIYEWNAQEKHHRSDEHREAGIRLYREGRFIDASCRFGKALKLLFSIPLEVMNTPEEKDGVKITKIEALKATLYNNLASCYLKHEDYDNVIALCEKVFEIEADNVKALYKHGVAWYQSRHYENAHKSLSKLLRLDPNNKAGLEKMRLNSIKLAEVNARVDDMVKKMFKF